MFVALVIIISLVGLTVVDISKIKFDTKLIIDFVIPPLIFGAYDENRLQRF